MIVKYLNCFLCKSKRRCNRLFKYYIGGAYVLTLNVKGSVIKSYTTKDVTLFLIADEKGLVTKYKVIKISDGCLESYNDTYSIRYAKVLYNTAFKFLRG